MASFVAARSIFRSTSAAGAASRKAATRLASKPKPSAAAPSPFVRRNNNKPLSHPIFRRPVEMSFGVESMMPYHTATASALMTSMLSISRRSYGWLPEGQVKTR